LTVNGKSTDAVLAEFQRAGFFVTHVLECPLDGADSAAINENIGHRLPAFLARIRRSLKPRRLAPISLTLEPFLPALAAGDLHCPILLQEGKPFALDGAASSEAALRLGEVVRAQGAQARTL
jgi:hypothetical protein